MPTVWILNHYAQEPGGPGGIRHFALAKHLRALGWNACIIAASVELNTGRQRLAPGENRRLESYDGVQFLWLKVPVYTGNGASRMVNMLAYALRALMPWNLRMLPRPQVVIGSSVHPFAAWAGARLARRHGVPFVFEVRDLWPQTLIDLGRLREGSLIARALRLLERHLYRCADRILILMPGATEYIEPLGISPKKIVWLPNGVDIEKFPYHPLTVRSDGAFTLMYFGAHGTANGLDNLIRAMAVLKERRASPAPVLRLIGNGPMKPSLRRLALDMQLDNVRFEDAVPKADIPAVAAQADAFVFNLVASPVFRYGISSNKLFDFMAAGRPVIFSCESVNNPVAEADAGITVPPDRPAHLADAIATIARMRPAERETMGMNARRYVERNHDYRSLAARLAGVLNDLSGRAPH
jgi:glycosyltransferase involved in cell wall biosynthesis